MSEGSAQNAGVTRAAYSFPPGTHSLRFAFRFTTPGDGDFLSVSFGDFPPIFAGKDMPMTRDGELTVDVPVEHLAGAQGDLVLRLVSRGQPNAVVTIHDLVAVTVEDADNDGLSNAAELALGTSAMSADTDGDGVADAAEVNIHLTSPLRADTDGDGQPDGAELAAGTDPKNPLSRLAITAAAFPATGFSLGWSAQPVRNYRLLRSPTPGFESYSVLGSVLSNAAPTQSFLDTTLLPGQAARMFYRVELVP